jgi:hypothetical protein
MYLQDIIFTIVYRIEWKRKILLDNMQTTAIIPEVRIIIIPVCYMNRDEWLHL